MQIEQSFTQALLAWFDTHGRKDLPWQHPRSPYRVYISEIMLQQTQVKTVIPYFERFMARFPTVEVLAMATEDEVLSYWTGLGYYRRARYLHQTAQLVVANHQGQFPSDPKQLANLPGIGGSTAAAIASLAYNTPQAILDGNVKRVLARYFKVDGSVNHPTVSTTLQGYAEQCLSTTRAADYSQAIMDLGATCCRPKQPTCHLCPLQATCLAFQDKVVEQYPSPNPKKTLPTQQWQFLLFYHDPMIYLEKRDPNGIWGALWSLPTLSTEVDLRQHLKTSYPLLDACIQPLATFKHSFTHFHLDIHPYAINCTDPTSIGGQGSWFHPHQWVQLGLPQPVKKMIEGFFTR